MRSRSLMIKQILSELSNELSNGFPEIGEVKAQATSLHKDIKSRQYRKLKDRPRCCKSRKLLLEGNLNNFLSFPATLEARIEHFTKRKRIMVQETSPSEIEENDTKKHST